MSFSLKPDSETIVFVFMKTTDFLFGQGKTHLKLSLDPMI